MSRSSIEFWKSIKVAQRGLLMRDVITAIITLVALGQVWPERFIFKFD